MNTLLALFYEDVGMSTTTAPCTHLYSGSHDAAFTLNTFPACRLTQAPWRSWKWPMRCTLGCTRFSMSTNGRVSLQPCVISTSVASGTYEQQRR